MSDSDVIIIYDLKIKVINVFIIIFALISLLIGVFLLSSGTMVNQTIEDFGGSASISDYIQTESDISPDIQKYMNNYGDTSLNINGLVDYWIQAFTTIFLLFGFLLILFNLIVVFFSVFIILWRYDISRYPKMKGFAISILVFSILTFNLVNLILSIILLIFIRNQRLLNYAS